jgi:tetratricopeptide (TPR) repeat protein
MSGLLNIRISSRQSAADGGCPARRLRTLGLVGLALFISTACSLMPGKSAVSIARSFIGLDDPYTASARLPREAPAAYRQAVATLDRGEFAKAVEDFSKFLTDQPTTSWTLSAIFNLGRAHEGLRQWPEAEARFRNVAEISSDRPRLQGLSLLRRAIALEALGEEDLVLATLKDAEARSAQLPREVAEAELPARLAAAYASAGNFREADRYFSKSEKSLARLRAELGKNVRPEWLPRILYSMGHRPQTPVSWSRFEEHLRPLERSQIHLLQAAEYGVEPWASLAAEELMSAYQSLRQSIDALPAPASAELVVGLREQQVERWRRLSRLNDVASQLRSLILVDDLQAGTVREVREPVLKIAQFMDQLDESIQSAVMLDQPPLEMRAPGQRGSGGRSLEAQPAFPGEE